MTWNKRPLPVMILGCLYIVIGIVGFAYHFRDIWAGNALQYDGVWIEIVRILALVAGIFMLRGNNWARWLALAWMAFHVVVSAFNTLSEFAIHCVFCAVIAWFLFRPTVNRHFRGARIELS